VTNPDMLPNTLVLYPNKLQVTFKPTSLAQRKFVFLRLKLKCVVILELLPHSPFYFASEPSAQVSPTAQINTDYM
jgi:hypothetical protein